MLHICVAVSCLSLGALLGRRGRSRGVAQAGYEERHCLVSSPTSVAWIH